MTPPPTEIGANDQLRSAPPRLSASNPCPSRMPKQRKKNFDETYIGIRPQRCPNRGRHAASSALRPPARKPAPSHNDIPGAFALLEEGDILGAADVFRQTSNLPEMCGRLCPQESLCEGVCVVGFAIRPDRPSEPPVTIGKLEAFCTDFQRNELGGYPLPARSKSRAERSPSIGSGPAGLAVAEQLALGAVTAPRSSRPGPNPAACSSTASRTSRCASRSSTSTSPTSRRWASSSSVQHLRRPGHHHRRDAGRRVRRRLPRDRRRRRQRHGDRRRDLEGVHAATDFLVRGNLPPDELPEHLRAPLPKPTNVVVIGGGDTSMDCVRTAVRLGAENVTCVYRRTEAEMLGRAKSARTLAKRVSRSTCSRNPTRIIGDENGQRDSVSSAARWNWANRTSPADGAPSPFAAREFIIPADTVAIAIGYGADPIVPKTTAGLRAYRQGADRDRHEGTDLTPGRLRRWRQRQRRRPRGYRPCRWPARRGSDHRIHRSPCPHAANRARYYRRFTTSPC